MKITYIVKKMIISNLGYIIIICGIIIGEKIKSGAPWINIVRSESMSILFVIMTAVIVELVLRVIKRD